MGPTVIVAVMATSTQTHFATHTHLNKGLRDKFSELGLRDFWGCPGKRHGIEISPSEAAVE